jgi:hypothetical protein
MLDPVDPRSADSRFVYGSPEHHAIANAFLDEQNCPGAEGLSEQDKIQLRAFRDRLPDTGRRGRRGPQPTPKQ